MSMPAPLAAAHAHLTAESGRSTEVRLGAHAVVADQPTDPQAPGRGPRPLELLTASLAACSAMSARSHLERDGEPGGVEVVVTLDAGPPPLLYRRVLLEHRLDGADARRLADALERTQTTMMLRPAFSIRTVIEHAGEPLV
jgi:uncharacterized OsmC-like protein